MSLGEELRRLADPAQLAGAAVEHVLEAAQRSLAARGAFHLALAGGSTPRRVYRDLAGRAEVVLARWHLWFGDERAVPPDHPDSNFGMVRASGLLERVPAAQVHRMRGEATDPEREAARYAEELIAALGAPPALDLVLLGLGADGHTASLFPGTAALEAAGWVTVGLAPVEPRRRLTLTLATVQAAREVVFLVSGADKAPALTRTLARDPVAPPARAARPTRGTRVWLVDAAAAPQGVAVEGLEPPTRGL